MGRSILTDEQREEIRKRHAQGDISYKALAATYGVSERTINRVCRPDQAEKDREHARKYISNNSQSLYAQRRSANKTYTLQFHKVIDADIIEHLDEQPSVNGYMRTLLKEKIAENEK